MQKEIQRLKAQLKAKTEDINQQENDKIRIKNEFQTLLEEKTHTIDKLQHRLQESENKITNMMQELLTGSTNAAIKRLQEELQKFKHQVDTKNEEIVQLKSKLQESLDKYSALKCKVKQNKQKIADKWAAREDVYRDHIKNKDEEFKIKQLALRDKFQKEWDSKIEIVSTNNQGILQFIFQQWDPQ